MAARACEFVDRRVLGLLRFVDPATGARIASPVAVAAQGVTTMRKPSGDLVLTSAPGFGDYVAAFMTPPPTPALGSPTVRLDLWPADVGFAPRGISLNLPRDPDFVNAGAETSLFRPVLIPLLPSPAYTVTGLVAALRVTVRRSDDERPIEGALVRLRPEGGRSVARAVTNATGEALLLVPGVPLAVPGEGATVRPDIAAELDAIVDPGLARFTDDSALEQAREAARTRRTGLIDPDDVEARLAEDATPAQSVRIASGRTRAATLDWTPP